MKKITLLLLLFFGVLTSSFSQTGETCDEAINLGLLTSPLSGTTVGALNDNIPSCNGTIAVDTAVDLYYSILVPNGSTLTIAQTVNGYDSENSIFYGDCTNQTEITCFDDPDTKITVWVNETGSDQTVYWVQDGYNGNSGTFTLAWSVVACMNATATYSVVSDCDVAPQFFVNVDVTDLGSATSMTVSDDQTSPPQELTAAGLLTFGPYANGTLVIITITNDQDADCKIISSPKTQLACPGPNDECSGALQVIVNPDLMCTNVTAGTVIGATGSITDTAACFGSEDDDVWFSFVATQTRHQISLINIAGSTIDMFHSLWTGVDCDNLTLVPNTCSDNNTSTPTDLTIGDTYYIRVYTYTATVGQTSTFNVCLGTLPPPPVNDDCINAIPLLAGSTFAENAIVGTTVSANKTTGLTFSCQPNRINDVWYSLVVPDSTSLTIETATIAGTTMTDSVLSVFSGTCDGLMEIGCNDDIAVGTNNFSKVSLTGLTPGDTLYIGVWRYSLGTGIDGDFQLSAYDASLATSTFDSASFSYYPNPVKDVLNLSYNKNISKVAVFNLLGQEVTTKSINANQSQIDMSNLASGTYLVKVTADNQVKTIKVIKE